MAAKPSHRVLARRVVGFSIPVTPFDWVLVPYWGPLFLTVPRALFHNDLVSHFLSDLLAANAGESRVRSGGFQTEISARVGDFLGLGAVDGDGVNRAGKQTRERHLGRGAVYLHPRSCLVKRGDNSPGRGADGDRQGTNGLCGSPKRGQCVSLGNRVLARPEQDRSLQRPLSGRSRMKDDRAVLFLNPRNSRRAGGTGDGQADLLTRADGVKKNKTIAPFAVGFYLGAIAAA